MSTTTNVNTIISTAQNETLKGTDYKKDRYIFQKGHGQDIIEDKGMASQPDDTIFTYENNIDPNPAQIFEDEINELVFTNANSTNAIFTRSGNDLIIKAYDSDDSVTLRYFFFEPSYGQAEYRNYKFIFNDKTITINDLAKIPFSSSEDNDIHAMNGWFGKDIIHGSNEADFINGGDGDDIIYGNGGNDDLKGGLGNDTIYGGDGDDFIYGGSYMEFANLDGNDYLDGGNGNDHIFGGSGHDILIGGAGNDELNGGDWESDEYIFQKGHGQDIIKDLGYDLLPELNQTNTLKFEGANATDAIFMRDGDDLVVYAYNSDDSVRLTDYFKDAFHRAFNFSFEDEILDIGGVAQKLAQQSGQSMTDYLDLFLLQGMQIASKTDDILSGYDPETMEMMNQLIGSNGNDYLIGQNEYNFLDGGDGDDILNGAGYYNIFIGGQGNDRMIGSYNHKDIYLFEKGHGQDTINDAGEYSCYKDSPLTNELIFKGGIKSNVKFVRINNDLVVQAYNSEDSVTLERFFDGEYHQDYKFIFDDGVINAREVPDNLTINGTDGNDYIIGTGNLRDNDAQDMVAENTFAAAISKPVKNVAVAANADYEVFNHAKAALLNQAIASMDRGFAVAGMECSSAQYKAFTSSAEILYASSVL
ncbi:calcium-binding protein [Snodgrassella alvi]|uniref:calcium-binding protein n=1 Tax=Snodgrassella alvi TaxID=1196083 RepID=UPI00351A93C9